MRRFRFNSCITNYNLSDANSPGPPACYSSDKCSNFLTFFQSLISSGGGKVGWPMDGDPSAAGGDVGF